MCTDNPRKKICLVVPSLKAGGMERVMSEVANYLARDTLLEVHLILLSLKENFFSISENVVIHRPDYDSSNKFKLIFSFGSYLRRKLKHIEPYSILSFGSMYNSFVLLFSLGLDIKVYISDRSNPYRNTKLAFKKDPIERHDGMIHYFLKKILYKKAAGILVQTQMAKKIEFNYSGHHNIVLFPNPIREIEDYPNEKREDWIINVGRFITTKKQILLISIFSRIRFGEWKLVFAGDGPELDRAKKYVSELGIEKFVIFLGNVSNIDRYYRKSKIFAFPSVSEGFPNALAEGLKASLACIAYDCVAGPSDLIKDGENGYLVPVGEVELFENKLKELMIDERLRQQFQSKARCSVERYNKSNVIEDLKKELTK